MRTCANGNQVAWPRPLEPDTYTAYRVPGDERDAADVPDEELRNGMVAVVRAAFDMDELDLLRETARVFGWSSPAVGDLGSRNAP